MLFQLSSAFAFPRSRWVEVFEVTPNDVLVVQLSDFPELTQKPFLQFLASSREQGRAS